MSDWKRLVDEAASGGIGMILLRGGEPFLMPGIIELIEHIRSKGIFTCIDALASSVNGGVRRRSRPATAAGPSTWR